ncbi:PASTA domain-containing protein [Nonomuraea sp. NPDC050556]|uniref:protein kinase domain-containing protein n=1 Tax=Nonomuraea sp. NPDC050556 TaxID=3364369 RepID=UPI0037A6D91E
MPYTQPLKPGDPRSLGEYELAGRLGQGGQGVVYLGSRGEDSYAVKLLHGPVGDEQAVFMREVELAKHVARFCTAQVVDAGFDDGLPYIVSEFVDGPSLHREVALTGPRRGGSLERLAVGTVTALTAIHRAGIVHRDFKPQNVLLGPDGPRVIDFGLARVLDAAATVSGRGVGTPAYMAPEQITASAVTGAVDVFAWGATMCFAANASAPFGQDSVAPVLHRILTAQPELGRLDGQLRELVEACLDKDPRNRPTGRELLLALLGDAEGVPAEVLRSPPPHILRVEPLATPESTGTAHGYVLPTPGPFLPWNGQPTPGHLLPENGQPTPGHLLPQNGQHDLPAKAWATSHHAVPAYWPDGPTHPPDSNFSSDGRGASGEVVTQDVRRPWRGHAVNRVGVAVSGSLLVSAAVLVGVMVPMLRHDPQPPVVSQPPVVTTVPIVPQMDTSELRDEKGTQERESTQPPASNPVVPAGVAVPLLVGLDRSAAVKAIRKAGLELGVIRQIDSPQKIGRVLKATPTPGEGVAKGSQVDLEVSAGVPVPALTGLTRKAAEARLKTASLLPGTVTTTCTDRPDNQVIQTKPQAGVRLAGGSSVALTIARNGAKVPSVVGLGRTEARKLLIEAGFSVRMKPEIVDNPAQVDTVLAQDTMAGTCGPAGTTIVITVAVQGQSNPDPTEPTPDPTPTPTPTT